MIINFPRLTGLAGVGTELSLSAVSVYCTLVQVPGASQYQMVQPMILRAALAALKRYRSMQPEGSADQAGDEETDAMVRPSGLSWCRVRYESVVIAFMTLLV